jgi:biotin carboxyl carrier protein
MIFQIGIGGRIRKLELTPNGGAGRYLAKLDGVPIEVQVEFLKPGILSLIIHDQAYRCVLEETPGETAIEVGGRRFLYEMDDPRSLRSRRGHRADAEGPMALKAPMPGRVIRMLVEPGQTVKANQGIVVIEAMKMQNELKAPKGGIVTEVRASPGETVSVGQVLAIIE